MKYNKILFHHNADLLGEYFNLDGAPEDYLKYLSYLMNWNRQNPTRHNQAMDLLRNSLEFVSSDINPSVLDDKSVVYIVTGDNKVLYTGSTTSSYNIRYEDETKRNPILTQYLRRTHITPEVFVRIVPKQYVRILEATYMNAFTAFGIPTCNIKCENKTQFYWMVNQKMHYHRINFDTFINKVWFDVKKSRKNYYRESEFEQEYIPIPVERIY